MSNDETWTELGIRIVPAWMKKLGFKHGGLDWPATGPWYREYDLLARREGLLLGPLPEEGLWGSGV